MQLNELDADNAAKIYHNSHSNSPAARQKNR